MHNKYYKKSWTVQIWQIVLFFFLKDMADYQASLCCEIEARLKAKCDSLADAFAMEGIGESWKLMILLIYHVWLLDMLQKIYVVQIAIRLFL